MSTEVLVSGDVARIVLSGEFDFSAQDVLDKAFEEALQSSAKILQIDLERTTFIDSSVLRMLLKLREKTIKQTKMLEIVRCHERLREIFEIGGFDLIFDIR